MAVMPRLDGSRRTAWSGAEGSFRVFPAANRKVSSGAAGARGSAIRNENQPSMSPQMFFAQARANWPSTSFGEAETPPAPFTGCSVPVAAS